MIKCLSCANFYKHGGQVLGEKNIVVFLRCKARGNKELKNLKREDLEECKSFKKG